MTKDRSSEKEQGFLSSAHHARPERPGVWVRKSLACFHADLHVEGSWISDPPIPTVWTHTRMYRLQPTPRVWGSALSKQLPREQLVSDGGGEVRGSTGESEGNQFLEKYCLSILCQELVLWLFFVLAQRSPGTMAPATHPSAVNSAVKGGGGLGRKPTKTTAKQNGVSKVCLFLRVCLCVCTERNKLIFFF